MEVSATGTPPATCGQGSQTSPTPSPSVSTWSLLGTATQLSQGSATKSPSPSKSIASASTLSPGRRPSASEAIAIEQGAPLTKMSAADAGHAPSVGEPGAREKRMVGPGGKMSRASTSSHPGGGPAHGAATGRAAPGKKTTGAKKPGGNSTRM